MKLARLAAAAAVGAILSAGGMVAASTPAGAVIYCKTVGYPKGCVARPVVHAPVVYCKRVGYPRGCIMR